MAGGSKKFDLVTYIFSDVFDLHVEAGGDEADAEKKLYRGQPSREGFSLIYLKGGRVHAYFSVNAPKADYTALSELIQHKVPVADKEQQLADPGFELSKLQEKATV
jgi:3-phenylpropionate/trans-cinnamate dioxygenase ferredoxin reductase component